MSWYLEDGKDSDVVVSSRVRIARNIAGKKFVSTASDEELKDICDYAIVTGSVEGGCPKCFHGEVPIAELKLPPYHPGCECIVRYHEKGTEELV